MTTASVLTTVFDESGKNDGSAASGGNGGSGGGATVVVVVVIILLFIIVVALYVRNRMRKSTIHNFGHADYEAPLCEDPSELPGRKTAFAVRNGKSPEHIALHSMNGTMHGMEGDSYAAGVTSGVQATSFFSAVEDSEPNYAFGELISDFGSSHPTQGNPDRIPGVVPSKGGT